MVCEDVDGKLKCVKNIYIVLFVVIFVVWFGRGIYFINFVNRLIIISLLVFLVVDLNNGFKKFICNFFIGVFE